MEGRSYRISNSLLCSCGVIKEDTVGLAICSQIICQYVNGIHNILFASLCIVCIYCCLAIIFHITDTSTKNS
jgi:hypothetical protein